MRITQNSFIFLSFLSFSLIFSINKANSQAIYHAPIGVIRDHIHKKGELMTSYRFSYMQMKGLRNGDDKISNPTALNQHPNIPTKMTMQMHMFGAMYGLTDQFTISAMGGFMTKDMDHLNKNTGYFNREVEGISDSKINLLYQFYNKNSNRAQFNIGLSLPTGDIDKKQPNGTTRLPYPMQIGSGSYELLPGISYSNDKKIFSFGGQINGVFRLESNKHNYKLGDSYNITTWIAKSLNNSFSISSRLDYNKYEAIEGRDGGLNTNVIATADPAFQERESLDLLIGANFLMKKGFLEGNRLAIEFGIPIYQNIAGPMLETDYKFVIGWQKLL